MSDDLVKRLRIVTGFIRFETGDRIAASACLSEEAAYRIEELEAKLAKAVDTLMFYGGVMPNAFLPIQDGGEKARATLDDMHRESQ
jgi:hypothetical protein